MQGRKEKRRALFYMEYHDEAAQHGKDATPAHPTSPSTVGLCPNATMIRLPEI